MQLRNTVQREDSSKTIGFSPQKRSLQVGDSLIFANEDHNTQHQPYPQGASKDAWGGVINPQATSDTIDLDTAGNYTYLCAIHSDETGSVLVANAVQIGASPQGGAAFGPSSLNINKGESVSWLNCDSKSHQPSPVGGPANAWTEPIEPESPACTPVTFNTSGLVNYECALHPSETGTIKVK